MSSAPIRVLVCGGRFYEDHAKVYGVLDRLDRERGPIGKIITGGASGADGLAARWAVESDCGLATYPAEWRRYGVAAGPIRNGQMLAKEAPDLVVAFPGGRGTADMVRQARAAGVEVMEVT